jgi:hypothetical protein
MQSRFLAGAAALALAAAVCAATPASAERWHHWRGWGGWGWGGFGLGLAAGAALDTAASPWWGPTYGYYDYAPGYWGAPAYTPAPAYNYATSPAYGYGYATAPAYTYDYTSPSYSYGFSYGFVEQPPHDEAYCMRRFRSYDPRSGTYLGFDGLRHPCP